MAKAPSAKTDQLRAMREARAAALKKKPPAKDLPGDGVPSMSQIRRLETGAAKKKPKGPPPARGPAKGSSTVRSSVPVEAVAHPLPKPKKKAIVKELQAAADQAERRVLPPSHPDCERCKELNKRAAGRVKRSRERNKA